MNRLLTYLILLIVAAGCGNQNPEGYMAHSIQLKNNLGELTMALPSELDTTYSWINYSDNNCAHAEMIRMANSNYSLIQETGFIYTEEFDSLYELTVSYPKDTTCAYPKDIKIDDVRKSQVDKIRAETLNPQFLINETRTINHRDFAVISLPIEVNKKSNPSLNAYTIVNGQVISFKFRCFANNCDGFVDRMEKSLKTIEIK